MKTLDQLDAKLEKRTPITSSGAVVNLTAPGSYYLTKNITFTGNGLVITSDNITVDLNGFSLVGTGAGTGNGIVVTGARKNIVIRNGAIRGFAAVGLSMSTGNSCSLENLLVVDNKGSGAQLGSAATVFHCRFDRNGSGGLQTGAGASISESIAFANTGRGIQTDTNSRISRCTALANSSDGFKVANASQVVDSLADLNLGMGINAASNCAILDSRASSSPTRGISVVDGSSIINCVVSNNGDYGIYTEKHGIVSRCTASKQGPGFGIGIRVGDHSSVNGCTANGNNFDGIQATSDCLIKDNIASINGKTGSPGNGIHLFAGGNRVDENVTHDNIGAGVENAGQSNVIVRNDSFGNFGGDYLNTNPAKTGPFQNPSVATSPWANF